MSIRATHNGFGVPHRRTEGPVREFKQSRIGPTIALARLFMQTVARTLLMDGENTLLLERGISPNSQSFPKAGRD